MTLRRSRREFLRDLGLSAAAAPFILHLPSLGLADELSLANEAGANPLAAGRKTRLVIMFSPNGVVPDAFWPDETGEQFTLKESLAPLEPFKNRLLTLHGVCDRVRGDGDAHMRGIGCLLTGIELFPGNIQGGSDTPAGWSTGISIDQEIKNKLQSQESTRTRFGSLEFGVVVPDRADTWTRMVYAGANKPIAPIDDPYQMFAKLYGQVKNRESLASILDDVREDLAKVSSLASAEDRRLLDEHAHLVREMERELAENNPAQAHAIPQLEPGLKEENDNIPRLAKMQIDLLASSFAADFARVATLQFTHSVGQAKMNWIGVDESHHELSHEPDSNRAAQDKLIRINKWYAEQLAYLATKLASTPDPSGGTLLDNTLIVWTNELGKGNSHTLDNIPFVMVGNGMGFRMGRSLKYGKVAHNRLLLALAHGMGHPITTFGKPEFCEGGPLGDLV
jgi:hypothetical protein